MFRVPPRSPSSPIDGGLPDMSNLHPSQAARRCVTKPHGSHEGPPRQARKAHDAEVSGEPEVAWDFDLRARVDSYGVLQ
jgi:hypothetical protein